MRRAVTVKGGKDLGKDLECVAYLALRKKCKEVFYWRGKGEVDFVVMRDNQPVPIQVTWDQPHERHERSLLEFYEVHPHAQEAIYLTEKDLNNNFMILGDL